MKTFDLTAIGSFLEKLAEKSDSVYWLSSPDFRKIQYISPSYEKIWGRSRSVLYTNPESWITYLHPEDVKTNHPISNMAKKLAVQGAEARYEENYRIIRPDGEIRWIIDRGFPIYDEHKNCCGVTGVAVDVTNEKRFEERLLKAKQEADLANKTKTEFLEHMRHDIRTPLTGIIGVARLMQQEQEISRLHEYSKVLLNSSEALAAFLNNILESINITSGHMPIIRKKFNLINMLQEIVNFNSAKAREKQVSIHLDVDANIPRYLLGDVNRINRVILELATNALKFTRNGNIVIAVKLAKHENNQVVIKLSVQDTGIGIPHDKLDEIFIRFKRVTPSHSGVYSGSGLGLAMVRQFIDELEAEIYVNSTLGAGTIFTCVIPLREALLEEEFGSEKLSISKYEEGSQAITSIAGYAYETSDNSNVCQVLMVEDHNITAEISKIILSKLNCEVDVVSTGALAIEQVAKKKYNLILMDLGLPDINGSEATRQIRDKEFTNKLEHTVIIGLTAHAASDNKEHCMAAGMNAVITKPLTKEKAEEVFALFVPRYESLILVT